MLEDFKKFALRGNVVDLAVGVIIGAAFGAIVSSLVADIIMPIIGAVTGGLDFSNYFIKLSSKVTADSLVEAKKQGAVLAWGNFLTIVINFLIIAWVLFLVIKAMTRLQKKEGRRAPPKPSKEVELLTEIRDVLKSQAQIAAAEQDSTSSAPRLFAPTSMRIVQHFQPHGTFRRPDAVISTTIGRAAHSARTLRYCIVSSGDSSFVCRLPHRRSNWRRVTSLPAAEVASQGRV